MRAQPEFPDRAKSLCFKWLGSRDSNPGSMIQSHVSYRWTTPQHESDSGGPGSSSQSPYSRDRPPVSSTPFCSRSPVPERLRMAAARSRWRGETSSSRDPRAGTLEHYDDVDGETPTPGCPVPGVRRQRAVTIVCAQAAGPDTLRTSVAEARRRSDLLVEGGSPRGFSASIRTGPDQVSSLSGSSRLPETVWNDRLAIRKVVPSLRGRSTGWRTSHHHSIAG